MGVFWRKVRWLWLLVVLLVACGGAGSESTAPVAAPEQAEPAGSEAVAPAEEVAAPEEVVAPSGAKPQFIEFYADW
ncbi:MAG TPA: hypothetical protein VF177_03795 [Anaerolineae bacterium]